MQSDDRYIIVEGEAPDQAPVRPHNWAERFAGNLASYDLHLRLSFSDELVPVMINDVKCLRMDRSLVDSHPELFKDVMGFAAAHQLKIHGLATETELPMAS